MYLLIRNDMNWFVSSYNDNKDRNIGTNTVEIPIRSSCLPETEKTRESLVYFKKIVRARLILNKQFIFNVVVNIMSIFNCT